MYATITALLRPLGKRIQLVDDGPIAAKRMGGHRTRTAKPITKKTSGRRKSAAKKPAAKKS